MADNIVENLIQFIPQVKGSGFQQLNKGLMSTHKNLFSLRNMFGAFFGYDLYSSVRNLIPELVHTSQQLGAMKSRFNAVSTSASAGADELNWVGEQSKRLGLDFLRTADDYSIFFATVSKNMGQGTTRKVFEQWAEAFRVLHIDPERQTRVLYALREMSSKGKIYMQDLALQLGSAVPDAMNIAAKSMGYVGPKAVERFRTAIKAGTVDVKKFIPLFSEAVNKQYVSQNALNYAMEQTDAQLQLINTHWQFMQKKLLESGMQEDIVNFLKGINRLLGFLERNAGGLYKTLKTIGAILAIFIGGKVILNLVTTVKTVKLLHGALKALQAQILLTQFATGSAVGAGGLTTLLGFLLNPWLLGAILVAGLSLALAFVLKKFFPNVWNNIAGWWLDFKYEVIQFMGRLMETPFMQMLTRFFGSEKTGFSKEVQDKQSSWAQKYPNHEFIFNVGGLLDAVNYRFNPGNMGYRLGQTMGNKITQPITTFFNPNTKIEINVDGSKDTETVVQKISDFFDDFKVKQNNDFKRQISGSKIFSNAPYAPGY